MLRMLPWKPELHLHYPSYLSWNNLFAISFIYLGTVLKDRYTIISMILLTVFGCLGHGVSSLYNYTRWRKVSLGQVRLSETLPIGTHWAVQVGHKIWKPYWFEIDGKTRYTQVYATTNIVLSHGDISLRGAQPTKYMGLTNRTDNDINMFNEEWQQKHPNYQLSSDNCQKYAADLIEYLCGTEAAENLPWQEGPVVKMFTYSSLLAITLFYVIVAVFLSRKEKQE